MSERYPGGLIRKKRHRLLLALQMARWQCVWRMETWGCRLLRKEGGWPKRYCPELYTAGDNDHGQLGHNDQGTHRSSPIQVGSRITTWDTGTAGGETAVCVKTDSAMALGRNNYGQVGDNTRIDRSSPVPGRGANHLGVK